MKIGIKRNNIKKKVNGDGYRITNQDKGGERERDERQERKK